MRPHLTLILVLGLASLVSVPANASIELSPPHLGVPPHSEAQGIASNGTDFFALFSRLYLDWGTDGVRIDHTGLRAQAVATPIASTLGAYIARL